MKTFSLGGLLVAVGCLASCATPFGDATLPDGGPGQTDAGNSGNKVDSGNIGCGYATTLCADGYICIIDADCESDICRMNVCQALSSLAHDGIKDGDETDIDCGGLHAPACADSLMCIVAEDCTSGVCTKNVCQVPTHTDNVRNGDESDIDCGGTTTGAPKCAIGKICKVHADCTSDGCGYDGKCAAGRSCTQHLGGDTCGVGEIGESGAAHESCCLQAPIAGSAARVDKYLVTAGRMRAFIERLNGDVLTYVSGLPASSNWNQSWNAFVPSNIDDANTQLGPYWSKRSCVPGNFGGHTYYTPTDPNDPDSASSFTQTDMDPKALNCVGWHLANAFCQWDGGRLPSHDEIKKVFTNNVTTAWPWGGTAPTYDQWNHQYNYGYPGAMPPLNAAGNVQDVAWYISPPGRFPAGNNANGVADAAGNMLVWNSQAAYYFTWTGSWDDHDATLANSYWPAIGAETPNGYFAIGFRCAHD